MLVINQCGYNDPDFTDATLLVLRKILVRSNYFMLLKLLIFSLKIVA